MAPKKSTPAAKKPSAAPLEEETLLAPAPSQAPEPAASSSAPQPPAEPATSDADETSSEGSGSSGKKAKRARIPNISALDFEKRLRARDPNTDWRATIKLIMDVQAELLQECLTTRIRAGTPLDEVLHTGAVVHWLPFDNKKNTLKMTMKIGENGCPRVTINLHDGYRRGTHFDKECLDMKYNVEAGSFIGQALKSLVGTRPGTAAAAAPEPSQ